MFFRDPQTSFGAGRRPDSNGGPPAARLGYRGLRSRGKGCGASRKEDHGEKGKWCAEVGPMLPGAGPRPLRCGLGRENSFERLVFAEVADGDAQWVDGNQFVRDAALEEEYKIRGVQIALQF